MNIPMLNACIEGYKERMFDLEVLAVKQGYWAGYYQSKKPRPINSILTEMFNNWQKSKKTKTTHVTTVTDVKKFKELEARLTAARK